MSESCRSCGAEVVWARHARTGRPSPIDAETSPDGNCELLYGGFYRIVPGDEREGLQLHMNHFATCVFAETHRKASA